MLKLNDIVDLGIKNGFIEIEKKDCNYLVLERNDGIKVELTFPNENDLSALKENVNINWDYRLIHKESNTEIFKDRIELYKGTTEEKITNLKNEVYEFINKIANYEIQIQEKYVFSIFGKNFLKYKVLLFKINDLWTE